MGSVFYIDPVPERSASLSSSPESPAPRIAPAADTFALHSNAGASRTILLDFDGSDVSGTAWNNYYGVTPTTQPAWDPAGDGPAFNLDERLKIQQVWAIVAEDYAPFDVDVTTEDPGPDGIVRDSSSDSTYGTRVLITPSDDPHVKICDRGCGGVAYIGSFDSVSSYYQPAWVFPQALGNSAKNIAEAASHEAGHNLGLQHDGTSADPTYYTGHGNWAPIMGVGYYHPLSQWSAGSYLDANNQQDDVAVLTSYLGARSDEASGSATTPSPLPSGEALISTRQDVDAYLLGHCPAGAQVDVLPAALAPNLDVRATLVDAAGTTVAVAQPSSGAGDGITASGVGASLTVPSDGDGLVVTVEGVGQGAWSTAGYDDYGSLGRYTVQAPSCSAGVTSGAPNSPTEVTGSARGIDSLTLSWSAPTSQGAGSITGYIVTRSGSSISETLPAETRSHTFTGLTAGTTYQLSVRAVNANGAGPSVTVNATTDAPPPSPPSAPLNVTGYYDQQSGRLFAYWNEPASSGTAPISGYAVYLDGAYLNQLDPSSRGVAVSRVGGFTEGSHVVGMRAVNAVGSSPVSSVTIDVHYPPRPANDDIANAEMLTGATGSTTGDNTYATGESTDPPPPSSYGAGSHSVWYSWTPSQDGTVSMRTAGGDATRDTTLAAYTGAPGSLVMVAGNDDSIGRHARISFLASAGTRYLVAVDGFGFAGGTGPFILVWDQQVPTAPSAPGGVRVQPGDSSATVGWDAPSSGGSPVTGYTVTARTADGQEQQRSVDGGTTSTVLTGLTNGTRYTVTVAAINAVGVSPDSAGVETVPDVPDISAPVIRGYAANARKIDPFFHSGAVTVRVRLSDDRGIVGSPALQLGPSSGTSTSLSAPLSLVRGDRRDGIWTASFWLDGAAPSGRWSAWTTAADAWGNTTSTQPSTNTMFEVVTDLWLGNNPAAPDDLVVTPGNGRARVAWQAPPGSVTDYMVWVGDGPEVVTVDGSQRSAVVTGLDNGTDYSFTVVAGNSVGESPASQASATVRPSATPTAPNHVTALAGDRSATVSWQPTYLNSDVASYRVTSTSPGRPDQTTTVTGDATSTTLTGLTNGTTYTFTVTATNTAGTSPTSVASDPVTPAGAPDTPTKPTATRGDRSATITWTKPASNGTPITGYTITSSPAGITKTVTGGDTLTTTMGGLTNGTAYTFTVTATNTAGTSPTSVASDPVTPAMAPGKVARPSVTVVKRTLTIRWTTPSTNGAPILSYRITGAKPATKVVAGSSRELVLPKMKPGKYTIQVAARNVVGWSQSSAKVTVRVQK